MSTFSAMEIESFLDTLFSFFGGQFWEFNHIDIHSIRVFCLWQGGKGLEGLGGPSTILGDLIYPVPLVLEVSSFGV